MRIETRIRRGRRLSLTSLIDVIFLLLLFFMLSSTFTKFAKVEISAGKSGSSSTQKKPGLLITLENDLWRVNGNRLNRNAALESIQSLTLSDPQTAILLVRGGTTSQDLVQAVEHLNRVSNLTFSVAR